MIQYTVIVARKYLSELEGAFSQFKPG